MKVIFLLLICCGAVLSAKETVGGAIALLSDECNKFAVGMKATFDLIDGNVDDELVYCAEQVDEKLQFTDGCVLALMHVGIRKKLGKRSYWSFNGQLFSNPMRMCFDLGSSR